MQRERVSSEVCPYETPSPVLRTSSPLARGTKKAEISEYRDGHGTPCPYGL